MKTFQNVTWRFSALAAFVMALALIAQPVQADPVLRGYWTFDYDTVDSGIITESTGYAGYGTHDGVLVNNIVDDTNGISFNPISGEPGNHLYSGNYISFTNDSYAYIQNTRISADGDNYRNSFDFGGGAFTISAWVKGLPDGSWEPYISKYGESGYGYQLRRKSGNSYATFTYRNGSGGNRDEEIDDPATNIAGAKTNLNDGNWHHLVAVYGGTYRELYMDGQLITLKADTVVDCSGTGEPLVFSGRYAGGFTGFANISLDDVAIYSGALRNNQITYLSQGGDPASVPYVDAGTKTYSIPLNAPTADDYITLTRNGNISRHWVDDDISFDGSSYLRTNLPVGSAGFNGSFTASAWVYLNSLQNGADNDQTIFGNNSEGSTNNSLHLVVRNGHPHMGFWGNDLTADNTTLYTGEWYYLTWQYDADTQTQKIYLGGEEIASRSGAAAFTGTNVLDIGKSRDANSYYLNGKLKGISITDAVLTADEIQYQMNNPDTRRIENFEWGKNDEWYSGGGAALGNLREYNNDFGHYRVISMYDGAATDEEKNIYNTDNAKVGNSDTTTGMLWGPQFTVTSDATVFSFDAVGGNTALDVTSRGAGGAGIALWDMTTGDYVRDAYNNVLYGNGNSSDEPKHTDIPINNLQGHDLMVVAIDRNPGGWGWVGPSNLTIDGSQVSAIADAAQHHIVLNDFNFDTAGEFSGMYEVDAEGNRLDSVTHFTNGTRNGSAVTNLYVDSSGTADNTKGFLSTGTAAYGEEQTTGILRSDPFLIQGDVMEYYVAGGNNIENKHIDIVDAETGEVYRSATGENSNDFRYDFWSLKGLEGKAVYLRVVDSDGGSSWSHLELDQIRQVKFAPTAAEVAASNKAFKSADLSFKTDQPGFNAESYSLANNGIYSLDDLASCITGGVGPDDKYYQETIDNFTTGSGYGVDLFSTLNVGAIGQYTLAVTNDEAYRITLNGDTVYESDGSGNMEFIPLTFSETGPYALKMLYLDNSGEGVSLYMATGAFDSWNDDFALLAGAGAGFVNSYAAYLNGGGGEGGSGVPEPSTWALLILGAAGMLYWRKRNA